MPGPRNQYSVARSTVKHWLFFVGKVAVSGLLIWWLLDRVDVGPVLESVGQMSPGFIVLALAVSFLGTLALTLRWIVVSRVLEMPLTIHRATWLTFVGLFFGQTLPSTIGGDVVRIWFLRRDGIPTDQAAITVILDRFCALASSLILVGLTLPILFSLVGDPAARWSMPVLVVLGLAGIGFLLLLGGRLGDFAGRWRIMRPFVAFGTAGLRFVSSGSPAAAALALALVINFSTILTIWLIGVAISAELSLIHCLVMVPPVIFISMVPISIAGWGVREGAMVAAFGFVGVPAADALVVSLTFGVLLAITGAPGGIMWLLSGRRFGPARQPFNSTE